MTVREAAERLGVSPGRVRHYILDGRLPALRAHPKLLLLLPADVEAFAASGRHPWGRPRKSAPKEDA